MFNCWCSALNVSVQKWEEYIFFLFYFPYAPGLPSNADDLFFLSFIFNLLSRLFGEASCGERIYLEDLILFSGRLGLGFGGWTGCQLQRRLCRYGGAVLWQAKEWLSDLLSLSVACIVSASLSTAPVLHRLHNAKISHTAELDNLIAAADCSVICVTGGRWKKIESREHFVFLW